MLARLQSSVQSGHELDLFYLRYQSRISSTLQERGNRLPPSRPIVQRPIIDVHPDKFIRQFAVQVAAELQGVVDGFLAMIQAELN